MSDNSAAASPAVPGHLSGLVSTGLIRACLIILLCVSFAIVVLSVFLMPIGGDEYIFLTNIHRAAHGWNLGLLQTAHVHLFWWLPYVGPDEVAQTTVGRLIYVGLWACSLFLLHRLGRKLLDPLAALVAVASFAAFSYSVVNAASFRIDGLVLPILLSVSLLLLNPTVTRVAAAGALSAVALALTIKAVLWAPAFVGVLAVGLWHSKHRLRPIMAGVLTGAVTYCGILLAHRWALSTEINSAPDVSVDQLAKLGTYMFVDGLFPMATVLLVAIIRNPATWALIIVGFCLAVAGIREPGTRRNSVTLLFLASPILCVTLYTNAFPYAYLVLIPTACLLAGKAFSRFMGSPEGLKGAAGLLCIGSAALPMILFAWELRHDPAQQTRQDVSTVHRLFKDPVPYVDGGGMIASFPRPMFPITRLGLTAYRKTGVPAVTNYIHNLEPPLLIVNSPSLDVWTEGTIESLEPDMRLLPQDEETIRATYAQYSGRIYLAGRRWRDLGAGERRGFEIIVPGEHTLLADNPVTVNGRTLAPGATITLEAGPHELRTTAAEPDLRILWGKDLKRPAAETLP